MLEYFNLIEALEAAPRNRPFVTHWVDEDDRESLTFAEFRQCARVQAGSLLQQGLSRGDRVILLMPQNIEAMAVFVGAMMLGAVPAFLAYPNFKVEAAKYRSGLAGVTANLAAKLIVIDEHFPEDLLEHVALNGHTRIAKADATATPIEAPVPQDSDAVAFIQHSAGTTGLQKGVALTHAAVLRQISHLAGTLQIEGARDSIYSWLPLYHDMGLIACFLLPMVCHVPLVMQSPLEWVMQPETTLQIITDCRCTLAWMPNFALQFIPRRTPRNRWTQYDLSSLRALINCSEPVRTSSLREFETSFSSIGLKQNVMQSSYAMAENVFAVTQSVGAPLQLTADGPSFRAEHRIVPVSQETPGSIALTSSGRLLPANRVRILNEHGTDLAPGSVGEILIQSDSLFTRYYNRPDLTAAAFDNGWYRTGDLGFLFHDELFVVGRKKDLIIVGGENLYPQDLEEIVATHPAIHDGRVVAMGIFNPSLGTEEIVIVAESEDRLPPAETERVEQEIRQLVVAATGVAPRTVLLKPPKWIVKSTAGKPARAATREKLLHEHPKLIPGEATS